MIQLGTKARQLLQALLARDMLAVFLLALMLGTYLHSPAFLTPISSDENWRQSPHWLVPEKQHFQEDDIYLPYAHFNTSQFASFMYKNLAKTGLDLFWGKFNAVFWFALASMAIFAVGRRLHGRRCGWISAISFMFVSDMFHEFSGGFMSGLSVPLMIVGLWIIVTKRWWWILALMPVMILVYPMVAIHLGVILIVECAWNDWRRLREPDFWKAKFLPLALAAVASAALLGAKYLNAPQEYGHLTTWQEIGTRGEFGRHGRVNVLTDRTLREHALRHWLDPYHLLLMIMAFLGLGKRMFRLPRGLWELLVGSCFMFAASNLALVMLYFPDRYVMRSMPIFMALATGWWLTQLLDLDLPRWQLVKRQSIQIAVTPVVAGILLLIPLGLREYSEVLTPGESVVIWDDLELFDFLASLDGRPMIASHPTVGSDIPMLSGKTTYLSYEFSHPYWTGWWETLRLRTEAFFTAYYTKDPDVLLSFIESEKVDYLVIDRDDFDERRMSRQRRLYMDPFNDWIYKELDPQPTALLADVPDEFVIYDDGEYQVMSKQGIQDYLDSLNKPATVTP